MKQGGLIHRYWIAYANNPYLFEHLWVWRPLCWVTSHDKWWNAGKYYCITCNKALNENYKEKK